MSEEEIIQEIRDNITDNEGKYMLCDALEDIIKNNNKKYDIQIIVSGLLDLYKAEKEKNKKIEEKIMQQDLMIDGLKENRRIAVEEIQEQYYVSKDKIKEIIDKIDAEDYYCLNEAEEDLRKLVE